MQKLTLILSALSLIGCATAAQKEPIVLNETITTKKGFEQIHKDAKSKLFLKGYVVQAYDKDSGYISFEPKDFIVSRGLLGASYPAKAHIRIIVDDQKINNTINVVFKFECMTRGNPITGEGGSWASCYVGDEEAYPQTQAVKDKILADIYEIK